eukprot:4286346-Amphidinium_carterae.1
MSCPSCPAPPPLRHSLFWMGNGTKSPLNSGQGGGGGKRPKEPPKWCPWGRETAQRASCQDHWCSS